MKQCNKCSVDLVVGENWYTSMANNSQFRCKPCHNGISKKHHKTPNGKLSSKKWNHSKGKKKADEKYLTNTKAGVYGIYDNDEIIYIGQSKSSLERSAAHFSKRKDLKQAKIVSNVSYALSIGELDRVNLTFKMLEYCDDTDERKQREKCLIQRYTPKYNDLYL